MKPPPYGPDGIRRDQTGWRDEAISQRHRAWGVNCPAVDLDLVLVEFNLGLPVALVEYKHSTTPEPNLLHPSYRALRVLAERASLPFFVAHYWPKFWAFRVHPVNKLAAEHFTDGVQLSEREFVRRLYRLRRLALADALEGTLHNDLPAAFYAAPSEE